MKKSIMILLAMLLAVVFLAVGCAKSSDPADQAADEPGKPSEQESAGEPIVLKFNTFMPDATPPAIAAKEACKAIEKNSGGRIKMETYFGGNLLSFEDSIQGISNGVVDIGLVSQALLDTTYVLNQVFTRPLEVTPPDNLATTKAYQELVKNIPALNEELAKDNLRWLTLQALPPYNMHTTGKVIREPADVKGMKLEAQGGVEYWTSLGAAAMVLDPADNYMALERGMVQGQVTHFALMFNYKTVELLTTHTIFGEEDGGIYCPSMGYFINLETWESLPPDLQQIVEEAFVQCCYQTVEFDKEPIAESKKIIEERGDTVIQLTGDQLQPWIDAMKPLNEKWVEEVEAQGFPAREAYNELMRLIEKYKN